jgi:hypothetical protein
MLGLVAALALPAMGVSLSPGPKVAKIADFSSLYRLGSVRPGQTRDPVAPAGVFVAPQAGDENRAIFDVTTIPPTPTFEFVSSLPDQLSGLFYDLTPLNVPAAPGPTTIYFGALGRNPVAGPVGTGGVIEVYEDNGTTSLFDQTAADALGAGPLAWDEGDSLGLGTVPGRDTFPTINQGGEGLWLQLAFIPFPGAGVTLPAGTLLTETLNIGGAEQGSGKAWATVVGGSYLSSIAKGALSTDYIEDWDRADDGLINGSLAPPPGFAQLADFEILFDIDPDPTGGTSGWGVTSQDPVAFQVIPEPVTMVGAFLAVGSIGAYIRKRRSA